MALRPRTLLLAAVACVAAFVVLLGFAYLSDGARSLDASALQGFLGLQRPRVTELTRILTSLGDPTQVGIIGSVLALLALVRGRPRYALFVIVLLGVTSVSSQVLKAALAYPRHDETLLTIIVAPGAFPSGHATAAMAMAIALVVVVPARLRPAAAVVGLALALGVSLSVLSAGAHFPSDVAGGYLLATGWALVLLAGLRAAAERYPERPDRLGVSAAVRRVGDRVAAVGLVALVTAAAIVGTVAVLMLLAFRFDDLVAYAQDHTGFFVVLAGLVATAAALLAGLATALSRRG